MDNQNSPGFGMGGRGGIFGGGGSSQLSPYFNVDPSYLATEQPEFISTEDQSRGSFAKSFTTIGTSVIIGTGFGSTYGFYDGIRKTYQAGMKGKLRRTQILNYTVKSAGSVSNSLGTLSVLYCAIHVLLGYTLPYENEEANSLISGGLTGALYKSTSGVKKSALGGAFGLSAAALWTFVVRRNENVSRYV